MVKYYDSIPEFLFPWIAKQKMFWVATAPLAGEGLINVSPKGMTGSFHVINANKVWYEDLTGSGIETVAHVRENGRITILFHAFEGPPRILRIYGKGTVYEFGTPEYDALLPLDQRKCGSRSIIMLDVFKIGTSCGYAIPFMEYKGERNRLMVHNYNLEIADIAAEAPLDLSTTEPPRPITGLKRYWHFRNNVSLSGLPGMLLAYESRHKFITPEPIKQSRKDDEREPGRLVLRVSAGELKLVAAFLTGVMLTASYVKFVKPRGCPKAELRECRCPSIHPLTLGKQVASDLNLQLKDRLREVHEAVETLKVFTPKRGTSMVAQMMEDSKLSEDSSDSGPQDFY
ncbi:hypothetical protein DXG01_011568 [Tephrocybe rancida]|nr:hypothetical protein DXG01_011568 [Tephrocybe rancida]